MNTNRLTTGVLVLLCGLTVSFARAADPHGGKAVSITGEVVDAGCYLAHAA